MYLWLWQACKAHALCSHIVFLKNIPWMKFQSLILCVYILWALSQACFMCATLISCRIQQTNSKQTDSTPRCAFVASNPPSINCIFMFADLVLKSFKCATNLWWYLSSSHLHSIASIQQSRFYTTWLCTREFMNGFTLLGLVFRSPMNELHSLWFVHDDNYSSKPLLSEIGSIQHEQFRALRGLKPDLFQDPKPPKSIIALKMCCGS